VVVTLVRVTLVSGRDIELTSLEIVPTYGGMLEGYPCARVNDRLLARLATRSGPAGISRPVHVITPPRSYPEPGSRRLALGPVEQLPAVYCRASFRSDRIDEKLDDALRWSELTVVWFQDDLASPVADFVAAAVSDLPWEELAEDFEF
jgi:hypothetical protein